MRVRQLLLSTLVVGTAATQSDPVITELLARNATGIKSSTDERYDWAEIHNPSSSAINLQGWFLTFDSANLRFWRFGSNASIPAGGYLVVYMSNYFRPPANEVHARFTLEGDGGFFALVKPDGVTIADSYAPYPAQRPDVSYGIERGSGNPAYLENPTPGRANPSSGVQQFVDRPGIFAPNGPFVGSITVHLTSATPNATIRYTTDFTAPTSSSRSYTGPLTINRTTCLRVAAFRSGWGRSKVSTRTFIFTGDVIRQPMSPPGFPAWGGGAPASDYEMDPEIVDSTTYRDRIEPALRALPSLSIVLPVQEMFGPGSMHGDTGATGYRSERLTSAELLTADGEQVFQVDCGVRMQGHASRRPLENPKHSFSLRFRDEYGPKKLREPLFPGSNVTEFDSLQIRGLYNNSWVHIYEEQRVNGSLGRDQFARDSLLAMGWEDAGHGSWVHLYLDGLYWGVFNLHERQDASHYAAWNGGNKGDYDASNNTRWVDGGRSKWNAMVSAVQNGNWDQITARLDVDNFIDFQILQWYAGNTDISQGANWRAAGGGRNSVPFRLYSWDAEHILELPNDVPLSDPTGLLRRLDDLPEFIVRFGDRVHEHFFNDGALTPAATVARWVQIEGGIHNAMIAESARWGDYRRDAHRWEIGPYQLYTRDTHWVAEQTRLVNSYFPGRSNWTLNRFRSMRLYPSTVAPSFSQHGGTVNRGFRLSMSAPSGTIYYTTDGTDPRQRGGSVSSTARVYSSSIRLDRTTDVKARVRSGSSWSAINDARFVIDRVHVNELLAKNLNGLTDEVGELEDWVELYNPNNTTIDVGGMYLTDDTARPRKWAIPSGNSIAPGGTLLIWCDEQETQGPLHANFKLSSDGEIVQLYDSDGRSLLSEIRFDNQTADIATGRLRDGNARIVTLLDPTPAGVNDSATGNVRYSALDPTRQTVGLSLTGTPSRGRTVTLRIDSAEAFSLAALLAGFAAAETPLPFGRAHLLLDRTLQLVSFPLDGNGNGTVPITVPNNATVGARLFVQTWTLGRASNLNGSNGVAIRIL